MLGVLLFLLLMTCLKFPDCEGLNQKFSVHKSTLGKQHWKLYTVSIMPKITMSPTSQDVIMTITGKFQVGYNL